MYRERALLRFRRYYLHGIRDGKTPEVAANEATFKTRDEILEEMKGDKEFGTDAAREDMWSDVLMQILIFRMLLNDIPIDMEALQARRQQSQEERDQLEKEIVTSASTDLAKATITGLEHLTEEKKQ
jgi:hypothetical protein